MTPEKNLRGVRVTQQQQRAVGQPRPKAQGQKTPRGPLTPPPPPLSQPQKCMSSRVISAVALVGAVGIAAAVVLWLSVDKGITEAEAESNVEQSVAELLPKTAEILSSDNRRVTSAAAAATAVPSSSEPSVPSSTEPSVPSYAEPRVVVKAAGTGRGRGLFVTNAAEAGELIVKVRPALTLLFEPFCSTHCLGCFADLHHVPGRQCSDCDHFAVSPAFLSMCAFLHGVTE